MADYEDQISDQEKVKKYLEQRPVVAWYCFLMKRLWFLDFTISLFQLRIASAFIKHAPPGEFNEVFNGKFCSYFVLFPSSVSYKP